MAATTLPGFNEGFDDGQCLVVDAQLVGFITPPGKTQRVVVTDLDRIQRQVDVDRRSPIVVLPALDLAGLGGGDSTFAPLAFNCSSGFTSSDCSKPCVAMIRMRLLLMDGIAFSLIAERYNNGWEQAFRENRLNRLAAVKLQGRQWQRPATLRATGLCGNSFATRERRCRD